MDTALETVKEEQSGLSVTKGFLNKAVDGSCHYYCEVKVGAAK